MNTISIATACVFGLLAVIFGAFGAHALKKVMNEEQLKSYETGVKYQMYHALVLLVVGIEAPLLYSPFIYWCFTLGIIFFSFSIYGLTLTGVLGKKWRWLGPVTPIGGMLFVTGWLLMLLQVA